MPRMEENICTLFVLLYIILLYRICKELVQLIIIINNNNNNKQVLKWRKDSDIPFPREIIPMVNRHVKMLNIISHYGNEDLNHS